MASKFKWHLDSECFHDLTSCHLVIKRECKCFISYAGQFIEILKKSIICHPIDIFHYWISKEALELACFKIIEHAK